MPNDTPEWVTLILLNQVAIMEALSRVVDGGSAQSAVFCLSQARRGVSEWLTTQQRRETAVGATPNDQLWNEACEAMRQTALRPLINTGYYPSVRYVDAPPLPPQYAGGHVPGSPHT